MTPETKGAVDFYLNKRAELTAMSEAKELEAGLLCDELKELAFEIMLLNQEIVAINQKLFGVK